MPRLAVTYRLPLWSVVFYVGTGAGVDDAGHHEIQGPAAVAPLVWHYRVVLPAVVARLCQVPDAEARGHLLTVPLT